MTLFNAQNFQTALNQDGEFKIAGRFLDGALRLQFALLGLEHRRGMRRLQLLPRRS